MHVCACDRESIRKKWYKEKKTQREKEKAHGEEEDVEEDCVLYWETMGKGDE